MVFHLVLEQDKRSYSHSLVSTPVELLPLPLAVYKTIDGFIPRPKHLGRLASFSTMAASSVYQCSDSGGSKSMGM